MNLVLNGIPPANLTVASARQAKGPSWSNRMSASCGGQSHPASVIDPCQSQKMKIKARYLRLFYIFRGLSQVIHLFDHFFLFKISADIQIGNTINVIVIIRSP